MAENPPKNSSMQYVWAGLGLTALGIIFILGVLQLRPQVDALVLIASVGAIVGTLFGNVAAYMKSEQTHKMVNSQLTEWKQEFSAMRYAEGVIEGTDKTRRYIDEVASGVAAVQPVSLPAATPVIIANVEPVPVKVADDPAPVKVIDEGKPR